MGDKSIRHFSYKKIIDMRIIKIFSIAFTLVTLVSCQKDAIDAPVYTEEAASEAVNTTTASTATLSAWMPVSNWNSSKKQTGTSWSGTIDDVSITADIANNGLILAFAKNGNAGQSLLYMQAGNAYWYYQVEQGHIVINTETVNGNSIDRNQSFQYVVLSADQLDELSGKGIFRDDLIKLSWEEATALFKK
jgi:hypothetical protein